MYLSVTTSFFYQIHCISHFPNLPQVFLHDYFEINVWLTWSKKDFYLKNVCMPHLSTYQVCALWVNTEVLFFMGKNDVPKDPLFVRRRPFIYCFQRGNGGAISRWILEELAKKPCPKRKCIWHMSSVWRVITWFGREKISMKMNRKSIKLPPSSLSRNPHFVSFAKFTMKWHD